MSVLARRKAPWILVLPAAAVVITTLVPVVYLAIRALAADSATLSALLMRARNVTLLLNTLGLTAAVIITTTCIALPLAWLTTSTNLRGRYLVSVLSVMPLAMPGYVIAYGLLSLGSPGGPANEIFGVHIGRLSGFWGALVALSIYNFPFMFINLRVALIERDPALSDAARSLGMGRIQRFVRVTVPQMRPAFAAGALLVGLYVFGDFGVVSLMRFETLSYAIFLQYLGALDRTYAAWLALILIGAAVLLLSAEFAALRNLEIGRSGRSMKRAVGRTVLGRWQAAAWGFVALVVTASLIVPNGTIIYWLADRARDIDVSALTMAMWRSLSVSLPAALAAVALAVPIALLERRYSAGLGRLLGRAAYVGFATPPLALALGYIFFVIRTAPWLYQTAMLLVVAYTVHFLAQALGPVLSGLYIATPRMEEASRSLGRGTLATLRLVTLPVLRPGLVGAGILVFLSCVKELPLTFLLAPLNFQTLSLRVYDFTSEAMFADAAPYALAIVAVSSVLIGMLFKNNVELR